MFVLDTNTVVYYFKGLGRVRQNLLAASPEDILLPTPVVYELEYGAARMGVPDRRRQLLEAFLPAIQVLPFGIAEARTSATIRAALDRKGTPIGPIDLLIAGSALAKDAVLVTHNTAEFSRVEGLKLADWF